MAFGRRRRHRSAKRRRTHSEIHYDTVRSVIQLGISKNSVRFLEMPDEFLLKSLYYNDLSKNIAN